MAIKKIGNLKDALENIDYGEYPPDIIMHALLHAFTITKCYEQTAECEKAVIFIAETQDDTIEVESMYDLKNKELECSTVIHEDDNCIWSEEIYIFNDYGDGLALIKREDKNAIRIY